MAAWRRRNAGVARWHRRPGRLCGVWLYGGGGERKACRTRSQNLRHVLYSFEPKLLGECNPAFFRMCDVASLPGEEKGLAYYLPTLSCPPQSDFLHLFFLSLLAPTCIIPLCLPLLLTAISCSAYYNISNLIPNYYSFHGHSITIHLTIYAFSVTTIFSTIWEKKDQEPPTPTRTPTLWDRTFFCSWCGILYVLICVLVWAVPPSLTTNQTREGTVREGKHCSELPCL